MSIYQCYACALLAMTSQSVSYGKNDLCVLSVSTQTVLCVSDLEELLDLFCIELQSGQRKFEGCSCFTSLLHIAQRQATVGEDK